MADPELTPQIKADDLPVLRAAYSDRTAALMATLARLAYVFPPNVCTPGPAPEIPSELKALGFDRITYFHNGRIDGYAFVVEGADIITVAFRGTATISNWRTDFHVEMIQPPNTDPNLLVHKGFFEAFDEPKNGETGLRKAIDGIKATRENTPIYLTGHSLGGALAQIATAVFGCDQIAACYTFGSPRVGNAYFDLWVNELLPIGWTNSGVI
jgi:triacylglycerol lipase